MIHTLKIWPEYYKEVESGLKTFEFRNNDRNFKTGDLVELHEWDNKKSEYVKSKVLVFKIGYVLPIDDGSRVVFSLLPLDFFK